MALCNELTAAGCQLLWTSRHSPGDLGGFLKKLVSRFRAGVMAQSEASGDGEPGPASETFCADAAVASAGGSSVASGRRSGGFAAGIVGVVTQIEALSRQQRQPVDSDLVRRFLQQETAPPKPRLGDDLPGCRPSIRHQRRAIAVAQAVAGRGSAAAVRHVPGAAIVRDGA